MIYFSSVHAWKAWVSEAGGVSRLMKRVRGRVLRGIWRILGLLRLGVGRLGWRACLVRCVVWLVMGRLAGERVGGGVGRGGIGRLLLVVVGGPALISRVLGLLLVRVVRSRLSIRRHG